MEINDALVSKLAMLSRLHFTDEQKLAIQSDLEKMIRFVDKLNELDTTGVEPLLHINQQVNILRDDEASTTFNREDAMRNAPVTDGAFFNVPKVIKK